MYNEKDIVLLFIYVIFLKKKIFVLGFTNSLNICLEDSDKMSFFMKWK